MTTRVVPSQGAFGAAAAELREPRSVATVLAAPLWLGFWAWHDGHSDSAASGLVLGVVGVVLGGLTFHRLVRRRRGLAGTHWASPVVAAVVMALLCAAANAVEPVVDVSPCSSAEPSSSWPCAR
jgi:hypothetical protein